MTNDTRKPREFWIDIEPRGDDAPVVEERPSNSMLPCYIHVIEYSAYEERQNMLNHYIQLYQDRKTDWEIYDEEIHKCREIVHATSEDLSVDLERLMEELEALRKERDEYRAALEEIGSHMGEAARVGKKPHTLYQVAREVLARHSNGIFEKKK